MNEETARAGSMTGKERLQTSCIIFFNFDQGRVQIDIIHRHFFFSPNDNCFSPKIAPDLGEIAIRLGERSYMQIA